MKRKYASVLGLLAACGGSPRFAGPVAAGRESASAPSYQARFMINGYYPNWTDIVVTGGGDVHKRACELAVASRQRRLASTFPAEGDVVEGGVARACAREPLPPLARAAVPGRYALIWPKMAGAELTFEAILAHAEPLPEDLRVRTTEFTRYPSQAECGEALSRIEAERHKNPRYAANLVAGWLWGSGELGTRWPVTCAEARETVGACELLPRPGDLARACKNAETSAACRVARERAVVREQCQQMLRATQRECEQLARLAKDLNEGTAPDPELSEGGSPSCRPE